MTMVEEKFYYQCRYCDFAKECPTKLANHMKEGC